MMKRIAKTTSNLLDPLSFFASSDNNDNNQSNIFNGSSHNDDADRLINSNAFLQSFSLNKDESGLPITNSLDSPIAKLITDKNEPPSMETDVATAHDPTQNQPQISDKQDERLISLLTGEIVVVSVKDAYVQVSQKGTITGTLLLTNYRISFIISPSATIQSYNLSKRNSSNNSVITTAASSTTLNHARIIPWLNIPLASIEKVEKNNRTNDSLYFGATVAVYCKDIRQHRFIFQPLQSSSSSSTLSSPHHRQNRQDNPAETFTRALRIYAFPNEVEFLFAFSHRLTSPAFPHLTPVEPYDIAKEFIRQGLNNLDPGVGTDGASNSSNSANSSGRSGSVDNTNFNTSPFRYSNANIYYKLCSTYPPVLVMPRQMSDDDFLAVAAFRSGQRLPSLCYYHSNNRASIWRSSQPKVGVSGSCAQDEKLLEYIAQSCRSGGSGVNNSNNSNNSILHIVDCRPRASAMANSLQGAGYEPQSNYPSTRLEFYNIPNIHAVRDSYQKLSSLVLNNTTLPDPYYSRKIEDSQWLLNLRFILRAAWETANFIHKGFPVLVHCSHGWDRTSQVSSLAQLFLDPYYRTFDGFHILVEKEWRMFGHPFQLRCAHALDTHNTSSNSSHNNTGNNINSGNGSGNSNTRQQQEEHQSSPIFIQFLDAVGQLVKQFPALFEFNSRYIVALANEVYACRFGTFLFNCNLEKTRYLTQNLHTPDVWAYLYYNKRYFLNPFYDPSTATTTTATATTATATTVFLPPLSQLLRNVTFWNDYFYRYSLDTMMTTTGGNIAGGSTLPNHLQEHLMDDDGLCCPSVSLSQLSRIDAKLAAHNNNCGNNNNSNNNQNNNYSATTVNSSKDPAVQPSSSSSLADLAVYGSATSDDWWEAAYRRERAERGRLEAALKVYTSVMHHGVIHDNSHVGSNNNNNNIYNGSSNIENNNATDLSGNTSNTNNPQIDSTTPHSPQPPLFPNDGVADIISNSNSNNNNHDSTEKTARFDVVAIGSSCDHLSSSGGDNEVLSTELSTWNDNSSSNNNSNKIETTNKQQHENEADFCLDKFSNNSSNNNTAKGEIGNDGELISSVIDANTAKSDDIDLRMSHTEASSSLADVSIEVAEDEEPIISPNHEAVLSSTTFPVIATTTTITKSPEKSMMIINDLEDYDLNDEHFISL